MTDSYKLSHFNQYPKGTERVFSYLEARSGAQFPQTMFFGLQYLIKMYLEGQVVTLAHIDEARELCEAHFGNADSFNEAGWRHIATEHGGRLPLCIHAIPEGTRVSNSNVLMTVENTCDECYWLTNAVESLLTHVWYPSTVATLSYFTIKMIEKHLIETAEDPEASLKFMLHDFGYRGATSHEAACLGGAAHLINSRGTDTVPAMTLLRDFYGAAYDDLAFSVPATEHSVMTSQGPTGEAGLVLDLLDKYPTGILSVVADSYDIYEFVRRLEEPAFKDRILARDGVFVIRPDSITPEHDTPEALVLWILKEVRRIFGAEENSLGYVVNNPKVKVLWGDGIDPSGIDKILTYIADSKFSAECMATFGMGGALLQRDINRDTQRFAFKCSAQRRGGEWIDIKKEPLGGGKASKPGRLALLYNNNVGYYETVTYDNIPPMTDCLQRVFLDGKLFQELTFDHVRRNVDVGMTLPV
jgi:nicotinamide phosphoribosyltransferase